jgi:hypothetical protein
MAAAQADRALGIASSSAMISNEFKKLRVLSSTSSVAPTITSIHVTILTALAS